VESGEGGGEVFREQTAPVEGDAMPYECDGGERERKAVAGTTSLFTAQNFLPGEGLLPWVSTLRLH